MIPSAARHASSTGDGHVVPARASGTSPLSAVSNAVTPTVPTAPGAPAAPVASAASQQATVRWTAPSDGGRTITGYTVSCVSSNGGSSGSNSGATSPIAVTSATLGKSYTCTVLATNAEGSSAASVASPAATAMAAC